MFPLAATPARSIARDRGVTGRLVVGITGASGAIYAVRFLQQALRHFRHIYLFASGNAVTVMETELGIPPVEGSLNLAAICGDLAARVTLIGSHDYMAPPASGSFRHDGMVIAPCSMGTVGRLASGVSDSSLARAADVCLKERRPLVLLVRETPLNLIHLRNLTTLTEAGAIVMPASPGLYHAPASITDLADGLAVRAIQLLGVDVPEAKQWQFDPDGQE